MYRIVFDYEKAFDSIEKWAVMDAMGRARIDSRYTNIVRNIYEGATLTVKINEDLATEKISI